MARICCKVRHPLSRTYVDAATWWTRYCADGCDNGLKSNYGKLLSNLDHSGFKGSTGKVGFTGLLDPGISFLLPCLTIRTTCWRWFSWNLPHPHPWPNEPHVGNDFLKISLISPWPHKPHVALEGSVKLVYFWHFSLKIFPILTAMFNTGNKYKANTF